MWICKMCWIGEDPIHITGGCWAGWCGCLPQPLQMSKCGTCSSVGSCPRPAHPPPPALRPPAATIMQGALLALTPLSILFSAFVFFNTLTTTNVGPGHAIARAGCRHALRLPCCSDSGRRAVRACVAAELLTGAQRGLITVWLTLCPCPLQTLAYMAALIRALCCDHPVAEVMLVLWAIGHLIEGAAGFGTGPAMLPREWPKAVGRTCCAPGSAVCPYACWSASWPS